MRYKDFHVLYILYIAYATSLLYLLTFVPINHHKSK